MSFLKQHKKHLKTLTKKQLVKQVINTIEITGLQYDELSKQHEIILQELKIVTNERNQNEGFLKSAESAMRMYENMGVLGFIYHKYTK